MTDLLDGAHTPIVPLSADQQIIFDEILAWLKARDPRQPGGEDLKYKPSHMQLPEDAEEWFGDNPDDYYVMRGYAGTGKSWLTAELVIALSAAGWNMAVTAPTNKAVGVIQDKVREAAQSRVVAATFKSLHSVCGMRMVENDEGTLSIAETGSSALAEYDLLLVDEGSMVDTKWLLAAIQRSRGKCLVLFIGDPAQLPPVMSGGISQIFWLPQGGMLRKIQRQAEGNPLIAASMKIREKMRIDEILAARDSDATQRIINSFGPQDRVQASDLMDWLPDAMIKGVGRLRDQALDLQREGVDARILCYTNKTVIGNNENIHFDLYPDAGRSMFSIGERVIVQAATKGEDIETGKTVDLVTSEELVVQDVEIMFHPTYPQTKCYQLVLLDDLGTSVKVYTPTLMTAYRHQSDELFQIVRGIYDRLEKNPRDNSVRENLKNARNAAWAYKNSLCEIRHTYSMTTHKSQGSSFDCALIDLPNLMTMPSVLLFNAALYVAVTRSRNNVFIAY